MESSEPMPHAHDTAHAGERSGDHEHARGHERGHHGHHHGHHHHALRERPSLPFAIGVALNLGFVVVEAFYGYLASSVALIADAAHNLGDVLGLALAWVAMLLARRQPTPRRTYGWRKSTILAALANALLIFAAIGGVAIEALRRLAAPSPVEGATVLVVAAIGVVINAVSALLFMRGRERDANIRGAFLHLVADALVSVGVVVAGVVILATGWVWVDPVISLVVSLALVRSTWRLLRDALNMAMDAVPDHVDPEAVRRLLTSPEEVVALHDLHIWAVSTTETALTAHLVVREPAAGDERRRSELLSELCRALRERFAIDHATLQLETSALARACALAQADAG